MTGAGTIREREARYLMQTYPRSDVVFVAGDGAILVDEEGREYLDFLSGIAVTSLGHGNRDLVEAATEQMARLDHVSNLFYTEPMVDLAELLSEGSIGGPVFFANSGSEANECAIKVLRKHAAARGIDSPEVITFEGAWHGRTYGAMAATPALVDQADLGPMLPGFIQVPFDDPDALESAFGPNTAGVMMETIQGEAGVRPFSEATLELARRLTRDAGALLVLDEVQTGVGRTGSLWSYQQFGIVPDVMTTAKALGGGMAIGACVNSEELGQVLVPGDHGSTFAAGPVASAAAGRVLEIVDRPETLRRVREAGGRLVDGLVGLSGVESVRGRGLRLGAALESGLDSAAVRDELLGRGLVVNAPRPDTLRLLPPFVVSDDQIDRALEILGEVLAEAR
ncbi:MAG: aspartate aminotransferase family protein [Solirubrobacterales bacterium]